MAYLKLIPLFLFPLFASAQDSTYTMPLSVARKIEADLRKSDLKDSVISTLQKEADILSRQLLNRDSVILLDSMRQIALGGLMEITLQDERSRTEAERKRRIKNGIWRNIFIGTTGILIYLVAKPE